jgi:glycosyltransferase involved in cell wall biosynthesis
MKIIHALGWYFPEKLGGTEVYVAGLTRRLRAAGHEVTVAAPLAGSLAEQRYEHEGAPVYRFPIPANATREECQGRTVARGAERFHHFLMSEKADWVHFHSFTTGVSLAEIQAAKAAGSRVMATNHLGSLGYLCQRGTLMRWGEKLCDGICEVVKCAECSLQQRGVPKLVAAVVARATSIVPIPDFPGPLSSALSMPNVIRRNRETQHAIFSLVDWFVLLNQWALDAVVANGAPPDKVVLNRLGVSAVPAQTHEARAPHSPGNPIKFGYFGRIVELKGVVQLAQAFAALPVGARAQLEFRGPGDREVIEHIRAIVRDDPRVTFCPAVAPIDAAKILADYDVLCVPSIWFENGPTVMMEAHAVGTPVIGTRIGAIAEVISDGVNGRLVPPKDVRALADAMEEVITDPADTIDQWRVNLPPTRTMDDITADYLKLYLG